MSSLISGRGGASSTFNPEPWEVNTLLAKHAAELESGQREHAAELDKLDDYTRFSRDEWDHYSREYVNETRFALTALTE